MYKIKNLKLTNFKFFHGDKNIKFDGKHALIYGENGSGKSSIYWALHCFLHSTLKPDVESVQKYFKHISLHDESIRNRYANEGKSSGVAVTLTHQETGRYADVTAEISNTTVNTLTNQEIKLMTRSSELINYKVIYNMYMATNRDSIKLFRYFKENLMEFIDFDQELMTFDGRKISRNSLDWWRYIEYGIEPYPGIGGNGYWDFQGHVGLFNQKLSDFLQLITEESNKCLSDDFKEEFKIKFRYTPATYNDFNTYNKGRNKITIAPEIELIVELANLTGKDAIVERPHSYLNEARLSSIAIAIRFAILKERYIDKAPRIMVLDDLLLSLDLGNRSAVLGMLLKKYSSLFQLIILTHDRVFFDCVLNHLSKDDIEERWKIFEMYEAEEGGRKIPSIADYQTSHAKALAYFKGSNNFPIDYNACGNNQRQALEEIFKKQFNYFHLCDDKNQPLSIDSMMINHCLVEAKKLYTKIGFDTIIIDELDIHRKQSMNPTSHHNPKSNFYKRELLRTFEIIEILNKHIIKILIPTDSTLNFKVMCESGTEYSYKVKILDDILIYKKPDEGFYLIDSDKRDYALLECNGNTLGHKTNSKTLTELYTDTCEGLRRCKQEEPIVEGDVYRVFCNEENLSLFDILGSQNN